ncbi:MAG: DUF1573 domain-containing protein [Tenuifilum sp.]|uniref:DUF1573 domain-containing protein n=1 Tax=Tenuifilum TaxID=2760873 RepID=UPI001B417552|nr:DUF1573 domain-containing protein [Bacteroidales bacterium]HOK61507.1 DUF1573 domain-containing protein [Tenuifilum sp.]MBP9028322.1 DUF1573 domain-containing protein [Bacteroidales bacterium]HOK85190.1 DUF1573 domain-containing protein [Tenuifilum sp.]HON71067.1 DUF1573 domain-containing protein [Tenuifilum sp.]
MRITSLLFGFTALFAISCGSNNNQGSTQETDSTQLAELTYVEDFFDVGTIHSGEIVRHSFRFRNTGNAPLVVKDIIPSCGCTKVDVTSRILKPGEEASVEVVFDSKGWFGSQYKSVTLRTNGVIREKSVTLKANVVP